MSKARKMVVVLLMIFGAVSGVMADAGYYENDKDYQKLKAWVEDMKVKYPHLKADDPERIEEYGEYPRLQIFMNDLAFLEEVGREMQKAKIPNDYQKKQIAQIWRKVKNSPKWKDMGAFKLNYVDTKISATHTKELFFRSVFEDMEKLEYDMSLADAKAGAFREMGGEMMRKKD